MGFNMEIQMFSSGLFVKIYNEIDRYLRIIPIEAQTQKQNILDHFKISIKSDLLLLRKAGDNFLYQIKKDSKKK